MERPRPIVLIVDVSGSMAGFSRALVQFSYGMSRASQRVEVFCFGTRLTRLTGAMRIRDPNAALDEATDLVVDWDGGTRIGESLATYVTKWGKYRFNRGAVVIICSDGLERGEPDRLAWAMQRLSRQAHAVMWVNPLAGDPKFQPLARGLVAALPFVDRLIAGHNIEGLEDLAGALPGWTGSVAAGAKSPVTGTQDSDTGGQPAGHHVDVAGHPPGIPLHGDDGAAHQKRLEGASGSPGLRTSHWSGAPNSPMNRRGVSPSSMVSPKAATSQAHPCRASSGGCIAGIAPSCRSIHRSSLDRRRAGGDHRDHGSGV